MLKRYPDKTTMWIRKTTLKKYSNYGKHGENYDEILSRRANEHDLLTQEVLRLRAQLKRLKKVK